MTSKALSLDLIRTDGGTQMRAELSKEVYLDYRDKWLDGFEFPPVVVFHDGSAYWLADGFHRFYGAREAKRSSIPADVRQGTVRDAILFAVGANQEHGLRRTREDKRRAVEALVRDDDWGQRSTNWIAETAGVGWDFAEAIRKEQVPDREPAKRVGKDGKAQAATKTTTQKPAPATIPVPDGQGEDDAPVRPSGGVTFDPIGEGWGKDEGGKPDLEELAEPYRRAVNDLNRIAREMKAIAEDERKGVFLAEKVTRITVALNDAKTPISQATPTQHCGKCDGKGCKHCGSTGWWPKSVVEGLKS